MGFSGSFKLCIDKEIYQRNNTKDEVYSLTVDRKTSFQTVTIKAYSLHG